MAALALGEDQVVRYARHVLLPEIGGVGQRRLLEAEVSVRGLSGPGSWAAAYLALAGVGILWLEDDRPTDSLLPLLAPGDLGKDRDQALAPVLTAFNPDVRAGVGPGPAGILRVATTGPIEARGGVLEVRASAGVAQVAWVDRVCPACRALAADQVPDPASAALAGSLAAAEVVARLVGLPRRAVALRFEGGRPVNLTACSHLP